MGVLNIGAFAFLAVIPVIILVYLLKQKAKVHRISSVFLWRELYKNVKATTWWEKLQRDLLLYLQLLIMLALIVALAEPYKRSTSKKMEHVILVMDQSASMGSMYKPGMTRFEEAKRQAIQYVKEKVRSAKVTIITCDRTPKVIVNNSTEFTEIKRQIQGMEQTDLAGSLNHSMEFLESYVSGLEKYEVVVFTDEDVTVGQLPVTLVDCSSRGNNLSLDYVSHSLQENQVAMLAKVSNQGMEYVKSDVNLYIGQDMVQIKEVGLEPGASCILYFDEIMLPKELIKEPIVMKAELNTTDDVIKDNVAYDVINQTSENAILLVTEQNVFLEKVIQSTVQAPIYKTTDVTTIEDVMGVSLYIFDGILPEVWPKKGNILLINPPESVPLHRVKDKEEGDVFTIEDNIQGAMVQMDGSFLDDYLQEYSFGVAKLSLIQTPIWAESFLKYKEYSAGFIGKVEGRTMAVLAFDLHESELPLQTQFPILMNRILGECLNTTVVKDSKITTGETIALTLGLDTKEVTLTKEGQSEVIEWDGDRGGYANTDTSGLYEFHIQEETQEKTAYVAVGYPVTKESSMTKESATIVSSSGQSQVLKEVEMDTKCTIGELVLLVAMVILGVEWIIYLRRNS